MSLRAVQGGALVLGALGVALTAFGLVAVASAVYLWLGEEKLDHAALAAAEGGMVFTTVVLTSGPLWARLGWGTWWTWEPGLERFAALVLLAPELVEAQGQGAAQPPDAARQMCHFWHVFAAYAVAWILVFGWAVSISRRLGRIEERLGR